MSAREEALAEIVALAERHGLTHVDVRRALRERTEGAAPRTGVLPRLFAFIGGTLVLAGVCVFVATLWDGMSSLERIVATLGPGLAAMVLCYMASLSAGREALVTPLFLVGVLAEPLGMAVALRELSAGGDERLGALVVSGAMLGQCALFFARMRRGAVLFFALIFGVLALGSGLDLVGLDEDLIGVLVGVSLFLVTVAITRTPHEPITPFWFGVSGALILVAWFELVDDGVAEVTEVLVACGFVYLSTLLRSRTLLAVGTLGLLGYIGYFSGRHFADSVGWPLLLIGLGMVMIALGAAAVRIHRRYIRKPA